MAQNQYNLAVSRSQKFYFDELSSDTSYQISNKVEDEIHKFKIGKFNDCGFYEIMISINCYNNIEPPTGLTFSTFRVSVMSGGGSDSDTKDFKIMSHVAERQSGFLSNYEFSIETEEETIEETIEGTTKETTRINNFLVLKIKKPASYKNGDGTVKKLHILYKESFIDVSSNSEFDFSGFGISTPTDVPEPTYEFSKEYNHADKVIANTAEISTLSVDTIQATTIEVDNLRIGNWVLKNIGGSVKFVYDERTTS